MIAKNLCPEIHYRKSNNGLILTGCYGVDGQIILPDEIDGIPIVEIAPYAFSDGKEAVDKITYAAPDYYDVVLMDIQMPVMDGYEATRQIRKLEDAKKAGISIFAMTANAFEEDVKQSFTAGMNGHLSKPIDIKKMYALLNEVLNT